MIRTPGSPFWILLSAYQSLGSAHPVEQDSSQSPTTSQTPILVVQCCVLVTEVIAFLFDVLCSKSAWPTRLTLMKRLSKSVHTRRIAIAVPPLIWIAMCTLYLIDLTTHDRRQQDCEQVMIDPDIAGVGVRISLYVTGGIVSTMAILGQFHAEPSPVAELSLLLWGLLSAMLFNIAKGFVYGMSPSQELLAAIIAEGYINCLSVLLSMKQLLAYPRRTICTLLLQLIGIAGVVAALAGLGRAAEEVGEGATCECLGFRWWGSSDTCGRVSRMLWLYIVLQLLDWIHLAWSSLRHSSDYEHARGTSEGVTAPIGANRRSMAKSIYDSIPATACSSYYAPMMRLLSTCITLETFLQEIGHQDTEMWQTWGQSTQIIATAWTAYRWVKEMERMFSVESVRRRRAILKVCASGTLVPTIGCVDESGAEGLAWLLFNVRRFFRNHPFGRVPPRRSSDHARFRSSDAGWTEILIDFRQWPEATDDEKGELLLQGSQQGDQVLVSNLLEEAAPVDHCNAGGKTALRVAIDHDHDTIVSLLLAKGANCNIPDVNGQGPLHVCSELGKETVAELLLRAGAHVNMTDTQNLWTPLHAAVNSGYGGVVVQLLRNRSDINARDKKQRTPLHIAIRVGNGRMARILAPNSDVDSRHKKGKTALYIAARYERDDGAKVLLDNGADRDIPDSGHGWTPLHLCARYSRYEVAKLLLMGPCNTDLADKEEGQTALHIAANYSSETLVDYLLDANCDMNCLDHGGRTALYWAAHNDGACTRKLIRKGADILKGDTTKLRVLLQDYGKTTEEAESMMRNRNKDEILSTLGGRRRRI